MPQEAVFVDGEFHGGAHMNLMVFTENGTRQRSQDGVAKQKSPNKKKGRGGTKRGKDPIGRTHRGAVISGTTMRRGDTSHSESAAAITGQL